MTNTKLLEKLYGAEKNPAKISELIAEIKGEIIAEEAKKNGRAGTLSACKRIIKRGKTQYRDALAGAWIDKNGRECVCDGFCAVRINTPLGLEKIPAGVDPLDLERLIFDNARLNMGDALELPTIAELKAYIKIKKAENKTGVIWDFGENLPAVNAQYLLDVLEALPGAVATPSSRRPFVTAIYFTSDNGDGALLPIRKETIKR